MKSKRYIIASRVVTKFATPWLVVLLYALSILMDWSFTSKVKPILTQPIASPCPISACENKTQVERLMH